MVSTLISFGVGVVASIIGNLIYEKLFKKQQPIKTLAEIEVALDQANKNSLGVAALTLEGVLVRCNYSVYSMLLSRYAEILSQEKIFFKTRKFFCAVISALLYQKTVVS